MTWLCQICHVKMRNPHLLPRMVSEGHILDLHFVSDPPSILRSAPVAHHST